jgi:NTP pyrophosphatase (non-canonical NTP hydrolase)
MTDERKVEKVFQAILDERSHQDDVHDNAGISTETWLAVLAEEQGEVAKAILEGDELGLNAELVQVAAVCVAWLESRMPGGKDDA